MTAPPATASTRERVVTAAIDLTSRVGWAKVTMGRLADEVGVSRQTVHHEVGTKSGLAEAMTFHELDRFLAVVSRAFDEHPEDLPAAIRAAVDAVLRLAADNPFLVAVVSATQGADTELLPLLTTHSGQLLGAAKALLTARVTTYDVRLEARQLDAVLDVVVRTVLSHIVQPGETPAAATAEDLAWLTARVLEAP